MNLTATAEEALQLAAAEGLTLVPSSKSQTGYKSVLKLTVPGSTNRFTVVSKNARKNEYLGSASTAEGAALIYARHLGPEASAAKAAEAAVRTKKRQRKEAAGAAKQQMKEQVLQAQRDLEARRQQAAMEQVADSRGIRHDAQSHLASFAPPIALRSCCTVTDRPCSPPQKRLLKEAQQRRQLRQAAERQQQQQQQGEASEAASARGGSSSAEVGATYSMEQPNDEIIAAVLAAAPCPYARLGLPPHAPREACRKSYLQLALKLHPDKCVHPRAKEAFTVVEEAFRLVEGIG